MGKYNEKFKEEIIAFVREYGLMDYGGVGLLNFCEHFKIDNKTFYRWVKTKPAFKKALDEAKEEFKKNLSHELVTSLAMAAKGYEREETEVEYVPSKDDDSKPVIKRQKRKTVHYQPNVGAAIFLLTNIDPEHYQNKQRMDVGGKLDSKIEIGFVDADVSPSSSEEDVDV